MKALAVFLILFSYSVEAKLVRGKIESFNLGEENSSHLVLLEDGQVLFLDPVKVGILKSLKKYRDSLINFQIDSKQNIVSFKIETKKLEEYQSESIKNFLEVYRPTVFENEKDVYSIFYEMRDDFKENSGQCYNMAHIWAYEEFIRNGTNSTKLFMFFTTKYIRKYRFPWWFHVAPTVYFKKENSSLQRVLDRRYTTYPNTVKEWTDTFVASKRRCKKVQRYGHYNKNSQTEDCYLIETSMYFWQPRDIRLRDTESKVKSVFIKRELIHAEKEAFKAKEQGY